MTSPTTDLWAGVWAFHPTPPCECPCAGSDRRADGKLDGVAPGAEFHVFATLALLLVASIDASSSARAEGAPGGRDDTCRVAAPSDTAADRRARKRRVSSAVAANGWSADGGDSDGGKVGGPVAAMTWAAQHGPAYGADGASAIAMFGLAALLAEAKVSSRRLWSDFPLIQVILHSGCCLFDYSCRCLAAQCHVDKHCLSGLAAVYDLVHSKSSRDDTLAQAYQAWLIALCLPACQRRPLEPESHLVQLSLPCPYLYLRCLIWC
jgi:hypothetical protein